MRAGKAPLSQFDPVEVRTQKTSASPEKGPTAKSTSYQTAYVSSPPRRTLWDWVITERRMWGCLLNPHAWDALWQQEILSSLKRNRLGWSGQGNPCKRSFGVEGFSSQIPWSLKHQDLTTRRRYISTFSRWFLNKMISEWLKQLYVLSYFVSIFSVSSLRYSLFLYFRYNEGHPYLTAECRVSGRNPFTGDE